MAEPARPLMSAEEFFEWCRFQAVRYELVDGVPLALRAMSGASMNHDAIATNIMGRLFARLRGSGCRPTTPDAGLRTAIRRVRRPDVTIECAPPSAPSSAPPSATSFEVKNPVAVFEILSPTTRKNDRNVKLPEYLRHPLLRTIVLIDPDVMDVLVYFRDPPVAGQAVEWQDERLYLPEQHLVVRGTQAMMTLGDLYEGIPIPTDLPPPRAL